MWSLTKRHRRSSSRTEILAILRSSLRSSDTASFRFIGISTGDLRSLGLRRGPESVLLGSVTQEKGGRGCYQRRECNDAQNPARAPMQRQQEPSDQWPDNLSGASYAQRPPNPGGAHRGGVASGCDSVSRILSAECKKTSPKGGHHRPRRRAPGHCNRNYERTTQDVRTSQHKIGIKLVAERRDRKSSGNAPKVQECSDDDCRVLSQSCFVKYGWQPAIQKNRASRFMRNMTQRR